MSAYASPFTLPTASFSPASSRCPSAPVTMLKRPGPVGLPAATETIRWSSSLSWWETPTTSSRPSPLTSPALSSNHRWVSYGVRVAEAAAPARVNGPVRTWRSSCANVARSLNPSPLKSPAVSSLPTSLYGVPTRSVAPPESPALPPHTTVSVPVSTPAPSSPAEPTTRSVYPSLSRSAETSVLLNLSPVSATSGMPAESWVRTCLVVVFRPLLDP